MQHSKESNQHSVNSQENPMVGVVMGSDSDLPVMQEALEVLTSFGIPAEITVASAHR
ncbi:MAG: AIR carboxylase family protein, partial [Deltaproteobacteria bacterium]|nr:AIR carboxylase family protein [Deltaproteobacteria bacterium]